MVVVVVLVVVLLLLGRCVCVCVCVCARWLGWAPLGEPGWGGPLSVRVGAGPPWALRLRGPRLRLAWGAALHNAAGQRSVLWLCHD